MQWRRIRTHPSYSFNKVFCIVPATAHYDVVMKCLKAGKHVLVEKPLTVTSELAEKLADKQKETGLAVLVGHTYIYNSTVRYGLVTVRT